jgi:gas vesicle protein
MKEESIMHGTDNYEGSQGSGGGFITGLIWGAAVGAALGLLLAPKTGAEMRRTLVDSADKFRRRAGETYSEASSAVGDLVEKGKKAVRKGRERVEDAVDEARSAYNEETSGASRPY